VALREALARWREARQQARDGQYQAALDIYEKLAANPAILYERARVLAGLGRPELALDDLEALAAWLADNPAGDDNEAIPQAMGRLMYWVEPELGETFEPAKEDYPHLAAIGTRLSEAKDDKRVLIEAGPFEMGDGDETHTITLADYYIDQYEVTNGQYAACVDAGDCEQPPASISSSTRDGYYGNLAYADYPVIYVDWFQSRAYCLWRGGELPTEAQWEKAARGPEGQTYPWGEETADCTRTNISGCAGDTREVGSYPAGASPYGVYDMAGNVWEWVLSELRDYPYDPDDGRENIEGENRTHVRVLRGGSWLYAGDFARATPRYNYDPIYQFEYNGFRCAAASP
jgi:formylglycine-generating enzyme required for sulfatase activity